jgi:DNA-binding TFAR19-related protein (PDSD5 family)
MKLRDMPDRKLLKEMDELAHRERELLSQILWHLKEIDQRKLYSEMKCGSLFEYCVKVLKYSEGQASRRVTACRLLREMPELTQEIERGELNLTQLNQAKHFFYEEQIHRPEDKKKVLAQIKGKTTRESERILWSLKKEDTPRKVSISINEGTHDELKKIQGLKAHTCQDLDSLLIKMCREIGALWDPKNIKRRSRGASIHQRYISVQLKAQVWERDQGKCQNCQSQYAIELDHIRPFALGGKTTLENLQLLCRNCNQRKGLFTLASDDKNTNANQNYRNNYRKDKRNLSINPHSRKGNNNHGST